MSGFLSSGIVNATAIPDAVTNHWLADEGSGSTVADTEGGEDLSYNGSWDTTVGNGGASLLLDGTDDRAINTNGTVFNDDTFTWLIWFKPDGTGSRQVIIEGNEDDAGSSSAYLVEIDNNGDLRVFLGGGDGGLNIDISGSVISTAEWNCLVLIADNGNQVDLRHALASDADTTQIGTQNYSSGTQSIGDIAWGVIWDSGAGAGDSRWYSGGLDDGYYASGTAMSSSDYEALFDNTKGNYQ
jgi:hypothetical protein